MTMPMTNSEIFQTLGVNPGNSVPVGYASDGEPIYENANLVAFYGTPYFTSRAGPHAFAPQDTVPQYGQLSQIPLYLPPGLTLRVDNSRIHAYATTVNATTSGGAILNSALDAQYRPTVLPQLAPLVIAFVALAIIALSAAVVTVSTQIYLNNNPCRNTAGQILDNETTAVYMDTRCRTATLHKPTGEVTWEKPPEEPSLDDNIASITKMLVIGAIGVGALYLATTLAKNRRSA